MRVDVFLYRHFAASERASSPRCVSAEAAVRGGFEGARSAEDWRLWALSVMGRAHLTEAQERVLRAVYLHLGQEHYEVMVRQGRVVQRALASREAARPEAEVATWTNWSSIARLVFGRRTGATDRQVRRLWLDARQLVADVLDAAGEAAAA